MKITSKAVNKQQVQITEINIYNQIQDISTMNVKYPLRQKYQHPLELPVPAATMADLQHHHHLFISFPNAIIRTRPTSSSANNSKPQNHNLPRSFTLEPLNDSRSPLNSSLYLT
ncbi:hypothetical protein Droror1_Dr00018957 [Drosera rotundifolia]